MMKINSLCNSTQDKTISIEAFSKFAKENPALLFPAFEMQRKIQEKIMGVQFWSKHLDRRVELTEGGNNYVSVKDILKMKVNRVCFFND